MYIPNQHTLTTPQVAPEVLRVVSGCNSSIEAYPGLPPEFRPPYQADPGNTVAVFVQITWVMWFLFVVLMMCRGLFAQCGGRDDASDTESEISDSAWRGEDSTLPAPLVASKHRKRLKKLDQVAPVQSLQHWRTGKSEEHIQTFATLSSTLSCAICLESLEATDLIRELQCGHLYHANCLNLWVERGHHDCPLCKFDMLGLIQNSPKAEIPAEANTTQTNSGTPPTLGNIESGSSASREETHIHYDSDDDDIMDSDSD